MFAMVVVDRCISMNVLF